MSTDVGDVDPRTTYGGASELVSRLLTASGVPAEQAGLGAMAIATADAWGVGSHGLLRLPFYLQRLAAGGLRADADLTPVGVGDTGPVAAYDGGSGLGHPQVWQAAISAGQRCAEHGIAAVSVGNSSHCGSLGIYVLPLLRRGFVGIAVSNGPAVMAPWGGNEPVLSTSPIAAGVPCRPGPVIIDMATSAVARGKIASAAARGDTLPDGWAVDAAGTPTNDPRAALAGMLAPLGGAKGFALALLVESLSGGIVGPEPSTGVADMFDAAAAARPQRISHLVIALDPARFDVDGRAPQRLDALAQRVIDAGGRLPGGRRTDPEEIPADRPLSVAPAVLADLGRWERRLCG